MASKTFTGYSTVPSDTKINTTYYDIEIVKIDLYNHFNTRIGERVMRPTFGCAIWDYLMEPFTSANRDAIVNEAVRVIEADARVELVNINVVDYENGLRIELTCNFIPFNVVNSFTMDFENRQDTL